ncbi:long-chain acyl-CoA synthetase [Curtobacterium sp. PhB172]|uniref:long-chain-fatty-acid--CoA ligase n=1 Tax=unclassified Curtobacterium TaxID=257496 RepID=UPI000F47AFD5|nr:MULTISPECIES: long-chain fatty acid--CoA ligase [unclassified Curtobacterium]ROQ17383.1 long-chain acyl-CoA synthetase [Curtobacterium sp. PhB171]ROQ29372.1 long-chain acyl-CoA synthetase [Curtobacterium sp. PhB170]ROS45482.1 long-chain acyl-CoA synthetase [Curtobacterium sp. PhB131]ROS60481.1 long-chain acyl-CoA synthetase [Curtobacterium sp. PhB172]ROS65810.1 long-chain acyl-CoA synthetase [Curtobacterium sp. PhB141]
MTRTEPTTAAHHGTPRPTRATASVAAILAESAARYPDDVAVIVGDHRTTYAELWSETLAYAGALRARGVTEGSRVAMLVPNVADFARVYYATLALGAVVVPVHALLKRREIEYLLQDSGAMLLVCASPLLAEGAAGAELAGVDVITVLAPADHDDREGHDGHDGHESPDRLEALAAAAVPLDTYVPRDPFDTATILYTSGTTGKPKGAEGSHFALLEQVNTNLMSTFDMHRGDVLLGALPLFHTFGQTCTMNTGFRAGATIVMLPKFDGDAALSAMVEHGCEIFMGVPTMYMALLDAATRNDARPDLRYAISGGASLPLAVLERFQSVFDAPIHEGYGLTETSPVATFNHVGRAPRPGTIGTPVWGVDVEIADPATPDAIVLLPHGEIGELVIRGHNLMNGYLDRPEDTDAAIVDGWFRTGDLGTKDDDGYLTIVDRTKDMIIRNGYNVYPRQVEEVLATHPDVTMAAVFGVPHELHGQEIEAAVVLRAGATVSPDELVHFVSDEIAAYKFPRVVHVVDALPLGPSGKVLKRTLVEQFSTPVDAATAPA